MRQCMTRQRTTGLILSVLGLVTGCVTTQPGPMPLSYAVLRDPTSEPTAPQAAPATAGPLTLVDLLRMSLEANPRLRRSALAVEVAEGKATQAGLYPNPTVSVQGDELGGPRAPGGIITGPLVSQEIVLGHKLRLSEAAARQEVDQATLDLLAEQFILFTTIRQGYFDVLTIQRRVETLTELVQIAEQSVANTKKLLAAQQPGVTRLDPLQLQVDLNRYRAELEAAEQEQVAAFRRLTATMGVPQMPLTPLAGSLEAVVPHYDFEKAKQVVLNVHPRLRAAQVEIHRTQLLLQRAQAEPIPNVTVGAGYVRQNKDRENNWTFQVSVPLPLWDRNQGNIRAAQAGIGQAVQQVSQVENELLGQLAGAYGSYAAARKRVERYRTSILPDARETLTMAQQSYQSGQADSLRVLQAQRSVAEARLEYNRALGELWRAASEIAGLLLEENGPAGGAHGTSPHAAPGVQP